MPVTRRGGLREHPFVHHTREIFIRLRLNSASNVVRERRPLMDFEQIKGKMLGRELERLLDVSLPAVECLTRQSRN